MRRYHFDLIDTNNVTDATGAVLDDDDHAIKVGLDIARDARKGRPELMGRGYEVVVRTDSGEEISRTALDQPPKGGGNGS